MSTKNRVSLARRRDVKAGSSVVRYVGTMPDGGATVPRIEQVRLVGLFGERDYTVGLNESLPVILTGPNGTGKTHVLRAVHAALSFDAKSLSEMPFERLEITFSDLNVFTVARTQTVSDDTIVSFALADGILVDEGPIEIMASEAASGEDELPPWIEHLPDGRWYDNRADRTLTRTAVERRYGIRTAPFVGELLADSPNLSKLARRPHAIFIDTKRLDTPVRPRTSDRPGDFAHYGVRRNSTRIEQYVDQIRAQVVEARNQSVAETQDADQSFALRALKAASATVDPKYLKRRYDEISAEYNELYENGLASSPMDWKFPTSKINPTVKRILDVFLDDWQRRLRPLLPIHQRLQLLREILDTKFIDKRTAMGRNGALSIQSNRPGGGLVPVQALSSGEQHLVALFTLLLFSAEHGSIVLIDEPEISIHAAWQHDFLADIMRVSALVNVQLVIATHSPAIINGHWELVKELENERA